MYGQQESWGTDVVSGLAAIATGYVMTSWGKNTKNPLYPLVGNAVIGVGGLGAKHLVRNEFLHEGLEAVGYAGLTNVGNWAAEATTTFGGKGAGAAPVFLPKASSSSSSGGAARQRAEAAARVLAAQQAAAAGRQPQPDVAQNLGNAHQFHFESVA